MRTPSIPEEDGLDFDVNEEQAMLRDLVARFGADHYDPVKRLAYLREPRGFTAANWAMMAETGLLAFALPVEAGGFGGSDTDIITVMEAFGRFVGVEPLLASILLGAGAVNAAATEVQKEALLPGIVAGTQFAALALFEHQSRFGLAHPATRAEPDGGAFRLSGAKQMVLGGGFADHVVVLARGGADGAPGLYLVDGSAPGIVRRDYRMVDGMAASDIDFAAVPAQAMTGGQGAGGQEALDRVLAQARLGICAELLGLMETMFHQTLDYLKMRKQFGQPLGSFQVLQHRMADCYARLELSRSQLYRAAGAEGEEAGARRAAISAAKAYISESAMHVGEEAVQLHGGIGVTDELLVGQAFKRVVALANLLGDAEAEIDSYVALTA